jgi:hypothetical protein
MKHLLLTTIAAVILVGDSDGVGRTDPANFVVVGGKVVMRL